MQKRSKHNSFGRSVLNLHSIFLLFCFAGYGGELSSYLRTYYQSWPYVSIVLSLHFWVQMGEYGWVTFCYIIRWFKNAKPGQMFVFVLFIGWTAPKRLMYMESNWPYFVGFGFPLAILTSLAPSFIIRLVWKYRKNHLSVQSNHRASCRGGKMTRENMTDD